MKFSYLLTFPLIGALYAGVLQLTHAFTSFRVELLTIISVTSIVTLSSVFMKFNREAKHPSSNAQSFIVGTTIQILLSLAFLLYARFSFPVHFRAAAFHFLVIFAICLFFQSFLLILAGRK